MIISRDLALEIFNLNDSFTLQELNMEFKRLSTLTSSDVNLFRFITECKDVLLKYQTEKKDGKTSPCASDSKCNKLTSHKKEKNYYINLPDIYEIIADYGKISDISCRCNIVEIRGNAIILLSDNSLSEETTIKQDLTANFAEYSAGGFIYFHKEIKIPDNFKNHKKIKIKITFMGENYHFTISPQKTLVEFDYTRKGTSVRRFPITKTKIKFIF